MERLCEPMYNTGRNITMDNRFTGYEIVKRMLTDFWYLAQKTKEFINSRNRKTGSTIFGFQKDIAILLYIPRNNKCVLLASTMHHTGKMDEATRNQRQPEII